MAQYVAADSGSQEPTTQEPEEQNAFMENFEAFKNSPIAMTLMTVCGVGSISGIVGTLVVGVSTAFSGTCFWIILLATIGNGFGGYQVWSLGSISAQINRFAKENERLQGVSADFEGELLELEETNKTLGTQVSKLQGTVTQLQEVGDRMHKEVEQFSKLKQFLEQNADKMGGDISKVLEQTNALYDRMAQMTIQQERALLSKIAQDLEFMDQGTNMTLEEFEQFIARIPNHLRGRFENLKSNFSQIAGHDEVIDFMEIQSLIDKLFTENNTKTTP